MLYIRSKQKTKTKNAHQWRYGGEENAHVSFTATVAVFRIKKRALIPLFRRMKFENKAMRGTFIIKVRRILDKSRILKRK
jgi:hypothetical protein